MPAKKNESKAQKSYSYDEYLKTFYPRPRPEHRLAFQEPKSLSGKLVEEAIKKIRQELPRK